MNTNETVIRVDHKYTIKHSNGMDFRAERYGEAWRSLTGDGLALAMAYRIESMRDVLKLVHEAITGGTDEAQLNELYPMIEQLIK